MCVVAPFLVLITFACIDVGQFVNLSQGVSNAAREGARHAMRHTTLSVSDVDSAVETYLGNDGVPSSAISVTVVDDDGNTISGNDLSAIPSGESVSVTVEVQYASVRWFDFLGYLNGSTTSATSVMRRE